MAFNTRSDSELESALDALGGFSNLRDIPVAINPRFLPPTQLLNEVQALLGAPIPELDPDTLGRFDGTLERQVLDQIQMLNEEKKKKELEEELELKEFLLKKEEEKELKRRKEEKELEVKELDEENGVKEESEGSEDSMKEEEEEKGSPKSPSAPQTVNTISTTTNTTTTTESTLSTALPGLALPYPTGNTPGMVLPSITIPSSNTMANNNNNKPNNPINYSEFEAESDPFESLALKSINDIQELAKVLQTSSASSNIPASGNLYTSGQQTQFQNQQGFAIQGPVQQQQQQQQQQLPYPSYPSSGVSLLYNSRYYQPQQQVQQQPTFYNKQSYANQQQQPQQPNEAFEQNLKPSKSYGDLLSEMEKVELERENLNLNLVTGLFGNEKQRKKSSVTPPPRVANVFEGSSRNSNLSRKLEDWVPWPELDSSSSSTSNNKNNKSILKKPTTTSNKEPDPLDILSSEPRKILCKQIAEMGFPLARVVRICQALDTEDDQLILNSCLLVNKFVEEEKFNEVEVEHVLFMKSMDEEKARAHLQKFTRIKDLGFSSRDIHEALLECEGDHDKALEKLLK